MGGMYVGTCYYSSSAKNAAEAINTDSQACSCNANKSGKFVCTSQPYPGVVPTSAPVPAGPTPVANGATSSFCPEYNPGSNTACSLTGMYVGTCYYSSSAKNAAEAINTDSQACSCNANKSGTFVCTSQPFPGVVPTMAPVPVSTPTTSDPSWCPSTTPNTNDGCTLPSGKTSGSCSFSSATVNGTTTANCSCDGTKFTCISSITPPTTAP